MNTLKVGDKIRILKNRLDMARVFSGDVLVIIEILNEDEFATDAPRLGAGLDFWFGFEDEGTGWEKCEGDDK